MHAVARRGLVTVDKATPPVFRFIRQCPGFTKWTENGGCVFEASKKHVEIWKEMFPDVEIEDADGSISKLYVEKIKVAEHQYLTATDLEPWKHQRRAHNIMMSRPYYGFFHDMGCFDAETEYLTPVGWRKFSSYQGQQVAQYHPETKRVEFVTPMRYLKLPCRDMIRFKPTKGLDMLLSPEHRVLVERRHRPKKAVAWYVQSAEELFGELTRWAGGENRPRGSLSDGRALQDAVIPVSFSTPGGAGLPYTDAQLRLLVAVAADGYKVSDAKDVFTVALKKLRKKQRFRELARDAGVPITEKTVDYPSAKGFTYFRLKLSYGIKVFGESFWAATSSQLKVIAEESVLWDGSTTRTPEGTFYSSNKESADFIQYAMAASQGTARLTTVQGEYGPEYSVLWHRNKTKYGLVGISQAGERLPNCTREDSPDGFKYCFEVPTSFLLVRRNGCIFASGNTGKSFTIVKGIAELSARGAIDRAVVVSTSRGRPQFLEEQLVQWMPAGVNYRAAEFPSAKARRQFLYPRSDVLIAVTTPGAFQSKAQSKEILEFCKGGKTAIFVDEVQNFKGWSSLRVTNLLALVPYSTHRFIFSGEPEPQGYEDLYAPFYFLDPNILGHNSLTSFENHFLVKGGYQFKEVVDYKHTDELAELIAPHCEYIKITDCMDMPLRSWHESKFKPTDQQLELYADLKRDYAIFVDRAVNGTDVETVAKHCKNAASRYTAMAQVACGWFYADLKDETLPREVVHITDDRAWFTVEDVVGSVDKCLVWARHHEDLEQIKRVCAALKIDAVEFSGRIKPAQCEANKIRFQRDPKCQLFYGTTASGGESLNLQMASRSVYYSNSFNWGHREQSERRTWRAGQTKPCSYWDIIGLPIDRIVRNNALEKKDLAMQLQVATGLAALLAQL